LITEPIVTMTKQRFFEHPAWFNPKAFRLPEFSGFRGTPLETFI